MTDNKPRGVWERGRLTLAGMVKPLVCVATVVCFSIYVREFFSPSYTARYNADAGYLLLLLIYAVQREIQRWFRGTETLPSGLRGEFFVTGWWLFYWVTVAAADHAPSYRVPGGLLRLCSEVTAIYAAAVVSYHLQGYLKSAGVSLPWASQEPAREETSDLGDLRPRSAAVKSA